MWNFLINYIYNVGIRIDKIYVCNYIYFFFKESFICEIKIFFIFIVMIV